jgi:hypothetical protein
VVLADVPPALLPAVDRAFTIGHNGVATISTVQDELFPTGSPHSEAITTVRGRLVVSSEGAVVTSHAVYPFVFRVGGGDGMGAAWGGELRQRLVASIHPVVVGADVYRAAVGVLEKGGQPTPSRLIAWEITVSISSREMPK